MKIINLGGSVCAAAILALTATSAQALAGQDLQGQDFENYAIGTTKVWLLDFDHAFGYFSGGTVQAPGSTVSSVFAMRGKQVYYGSDLLFNSLFPPADHSSNYGRYEMRITAPNGALLQIFGHEDPDAEAGSPGFNNQIVQFETILTGTDMYFVWGTLCGDNGCSWIEPGQTSDITSIRWTSLDGSAIAIDNVGGQGIATVPEPATWALLITGFGLVGAAMRRRPGKADPCLPQMSS